MSLPETATLARRLVRVREALDSLSLDALIVTDLINIRYLSNHAGSAGILILTRDAVHLLIDFRYETALRELQDSPSACPALRMWTVPGSYDEALVECLVEISAGNTGFEATQLSVARYDWLTRTLASRCSLHPTRPPVLPPTSHRRLFWGLRWTTGRIFTPWAVWPIGW